MLTRLLLSTCLALASMTTAEEIPNAFTRDASDESSSLGNFDRKAAAPKSIRIQMEHVMLSQPDFTRLLMEDQSKTTDSSILRTKVQTLIDNGKAKVIDNFIQLGNDKEELKVESGREKTYPTSFTTKPGKSDNTTDKADTTDPAATAILPNEIDSRKVGNELVANFHLIDDQTLSVRLSSSITTHVSDTVWQQRKNNTGEVMKITTPDFYTMRFDTDIHCVSGQTVLVSVLNPKDAAGNMDASNKVMVFLKCTILPSIP